MAATLRPRRSVLFMPGSNARAQQKARSLPVDAVILDLEDAVAPGEKEAARQQVAATLSEGGFGAREIIIRINGLMTPWGQGDIEALAGAGADAILIPKVENRQIVASVESRLRQAGAPPGTAVWCMIETPKGILHAEEIAAASPSLGALVMGTSDLAKDLQARHTRGRQPFLASLSWCILAARAYRLAILDGVHLDLDDDEGFRETCRQGRELGFDGRTLIHPKTIADANEAYAPTQDEIDWSRRVIAAHEAADRAGQGVVLLDGQLIENLHVEEARRVAALADMIAELEAG